METFRNFCDKCGGKIVKGKCTCGNWYAHDEKPNFLKIMEQAIYAYDHICEQYNDDSPITGDHHSGNCMVLFNGTYEDTQKVKQFIIDMQGGK